MNTASLVPDSRLASALFNPASIALVGASDDPGKTAGRPQRYLSQAGFAGKVYPVNPSRSTVQGVPAWKSLADLPEIPEHVFVLTPTESVLPTVRECARLGVIVVTILASGFSEEGSLGAERENELRQLARNTGIRLLGPSSIGVVNPRNGLVLTANAAFAEPDLPRGRVLVASHSGSMIGALVSRGIARGVGFAGLISVGNEADLSLGEVCAATLDDPEIDGYLLFLESLQHGAALRDFALAAAARGKPVIAYKLGRSNEAAEMAATHTGALAGEDDVADAFLKDCGIARVGVIEALLEAYPLARRIQLARGSVSPRVGVVTTTGGGAAMAVDQLGIRGVTVEPPSDDTLRRLRERGIQVGQGRVVDLTLKGVNYGVMKSALDVLLDAPEFDLVLATIGSSARFQPQLAVKPIIDSKDHEKPLVAMMVPDAPEALRALTAAGVACFRGPEACADVIAAVFARRAPRDTVRLAPQINGKSLFISEAQAYEIMDVLGVPHAPAIVISLNAKQIELPFEFPVVVKVCSADIPHKTEVGGIVLGVGNAEELQGALGTLRANLVCNAPHVQCEQALVQPMRAGLAEVLVGYRVDADAGPIITLAAGGIWAEIARDRSIRLAPVSLEQAWEMIGEVKALATLTGLRGKPRGDLQALAEAVSALSLLANRPEMCVAEAEVNPMMVMHEGEGVAAVDALVLRYPDYSNQARSE